MRDLQSMSLQELFDELAGNDCVTRLLELALREDLGQAGDITSTSIVQPSACGTGMFVARQAGIVSGLRVLPMLVKQLAAQDRQFTGVVQVVAHAQDGNRCAAGETLANIEGNQRAILALERTALNLLSHLSGVASLTAQFVEATAGTNAVICDTRKTMPGLRVMDKYAVRCGGGTLHRLGLFDAALYKDNHLAGVPIEDLREVVVHAAQSVRTNHDVRFVEVEVDSLAQLEQLLEAPPGVLDMILLDNFAVGDLRLAVQLRDERAPQVQLEASGHVQLDTVHRIGETGVDRISIGALTHSAPHLDIGLDVQSHDRIGSGNRNVAGTA